MHTTVTQYFQHTHISGPISVGGTEAEAGGTGPIWYLQNANELIFTIFLDSSFKLRSFASSHHPLSSKYCRNLEIGESKLFHCFTSSSDL
jgi:hypothetical protein